MPTFRSPGSMSMTLTDMADVHREEMEREPEQIGAEVLRRLKLGLDISGRDYIGEGGMPIGVQLVADSFGEALLFRAGVDFQQRTDFHLARPPLLQEATSRGRHCCAKDDRPWVEEQTDERTDYVCLCRGIAK
jgi:hypothetical protein